MSASEGIRLSEFPIRYAESVLDSSESEADRLAGRAYMAHANEDAYRLAREALALDPEQVDALVLAATRRPATREERIAEVRHAVTVAERKLGAESSLLNQGRYWEQREGKTYMAATLALADLLRRARQYEEAVALYQRLLDLDAGDPLEVRYTLLGHFLERGDTARAGAVIARFPDDESPVMCWAKVLHQFRRGDYAAAREEREYAMTLNHWVEEYLTGRWKYDARHRPVMYITHSPGEALLVLHYLWDAWQAYPEAIQWLKKGAKPPKAKKSRK